MAQAPSPSRSFWTHPWLPYLLIAVVAVGILVPGTWQLPLIDRDEPRFAQATWEMIDRHEWIIPYFNHHYRFDKPVLTYWLMRGGYWLFGVDPFGARFHSIVCALLTALVICALGRRHFSDRIGAGAALGFLTCFQVFLHGRSATADMPMILAVTVSQAALYELLCREEAPAHPRRWFFILYTALGLGFLAKGPIAVLVPLLTVLLLRLVLWRRPLPWSRLKCQWGLPLFLVIVGAWGVPALYLTKGLFWQVGMEKHVIDRGLEVFNGRFYSPLFYLVTAFFSLCPWIAFAGSGYEAVRARWDRSNAFLVAWLLSPYLIFTFYATQLPHYVMPGFPAFFLLTAQALERPEGGRPWTRWWWRGAIALPALLAVVFALALIYGIAREASWQILLVLLAGALLTSAAVVLAIAAKARRGWAVVAGVLLMAASALSLGRGLQRLVPAAQMQPLFNRMPAATRYLAYRFTEGSLVFYSHGQWEMTDDAHELARFLTGDGPRLAVVLEREIKIERYLKWELHRHMDPAAVLDQNDYSRQIGDLDTHGYLHQDVSGLNLGNFSWVTIRVYYRVSEGGK
jgi:4-amino-4-deoxy-L-arabinose transferase-like glycosyltransferase